MVKINRGKFSLVHEDADLFHRSEWDDEDGPSTWYVVYRVILALFMATGVTLHFVSTLDTLGIKWFIYMTNQGSNTTNKNKKTNLVNARYWVVDAPLSHLCRHRGGQKALLS